MEYLNRGEPEPRHRLIILTDMENEPDDSQTMVKLLVYANELEIEGLIAVTSRWLQHEIYPESIEDRVRAYGIVRPNLQKHAAGWPTEEAALEDRWRQYRLWHGGSGRREEHSGIGAYHRGRR